MPTALEKTLAKKRLQRIQEQKEDQTLPPKRWLRKYFPEHFDKPLAEHHQQFWDWVWSLEPGERPRPLLFCLNRGGGKSASAEASAAIVGAVPDGQPLTRNYVLYVSGTQDQADDHVQTIGQHLEASRIEETYPKLGKARVGEYGDRWGWNRQRLVTEKGLIIDAYGLFGSGRGAKLEQYRPDYIILDDIDDETDSRKVVRKKEHRLQQQVIPSGADDRAILFIQNLVHSNSVMRRLIEGESEWLLNRKEIGPIKAAENLQYEKSFDEQVGRATYEVTGGTATWEGFDLQDIEDEINEVGPTSFLIEYQHEVERAGGGIFDPVEYERCTWEDVPELIRVAVWVDPAVTSDEDVSDCMAIQADALGADDRIYRLFSWEEVSSPEKALRKALLKAVELGADTVGVETDQGGETWKSVYKRAWQHLVDQDHYPHITEQTHRPGFKEDKASSHQKGKTARGLQMLEDYERGQVVHVQGTHNTLERALDRAFVTEPFDLADASFYSWFDLRETGRISVDTVA